MLAQIREIARVFGELAKALPALNYKQAKDDKKTSLGAVFENTAARYPDNIMLLFEGRQWTFDALNSQVNQLAHLLQARGVCRGDTVALFMENRVEYVLSILAVAKIGAAASLINNSLSGAPLVHCFKSTNTKSCIVGEERTDALAEVRGELGLDEKSGYLWFPDRGAAPAPDWAADAGTAMGKMPKDDLQITQEITAGEVALYVFTSGTTGLPKAAIVLHRKILAAGHGMGRIGFQIKPEDRLYLCLPIYHMTGLGPGLCGFILMGGSVVLRRSFSASNFWPEVQKYQANCFIYVGELCRYLSAQPECPEEKNNPLQKMLGNGLRPDVWDAFKGRFGVARICEIYGASEGNVSFLNLLNKDKTIGAAISKVALVQYDDDSDEIVRDGAGRCIEVPIGRPGLLLGEISANTAFDGYTNPEATAGKVVHNVLKEGDRWFNTGDLVRRIDVGFALGLKHFQFVDRMGDTFRWRSQNVSTNEVAEAINAHPQVNIANVYGVEVPGTEGRAGMVAFELPPGEDLDLTTFRKLVEQQLPAYAQPVFIRILRTTQTTETFKLIKGDLREQAFHLDKVGEDPIYVCKPRSQHYERLDQHFYQQIIEGASGF